MKWINMGVKLVREYFKNDRKLLKHRTVHQQNKAKQQKIPPKAKEAQKVKQVDEKKKIEGLKSEVKKEVQKQGKDLKPHVKEADEVGKTPTKASETPTKDDSSSYQPTREHQMARAPQQQDKGMSL